jgi:uncharacterized damage-inducible protein DinB
MQAADFQVLFDHMYWVNRQLLDAAAGLTPAQFREPTRVTTRSLRATLVHELDVEWSWRENLRGKPMEEWGEDDELKPEDYPDVQSLRNHWARDEEDMRAWLMTLSDEDIQRPVPSAFTRDERPLWQYLLHILTHAAQQQADAATLLTLSGRSPGDLDFLAYRQATERPGSPI